MLSHYGIMLFAVTYKFVVGNKGICFIAIIFPCSLLTTSQAYTTKRRGWVA